MLELLWRRSESKEAFTVLPSEPIGLRTADVSKAKAVDLFSEFGELWLLDLTESAERFCILSVLEAFLSLGQGNSCVVFGNYDVSGVGHILSIQSNLYNIHAAPTCTE